jgi:uncharacterized protein
MKALDILTMVLLIVGGLNWGMWGVAEFDLVAALLGGSTAILAKAVYILVGLAAVYQGIRLPALLQSRSVRPAMA